MNNLSKTCLNDRTYADIKFTFPNLRTAEVIYGHRKVISRQCPSLLENVPVKKSSKSIAVIEDNVSIAGFTEFLKYIYVGCCDLPLQYFDELITLSVKYDMYDFEMYLIIAYIMKKHTTNPEKALDLCNTRPYECQIFKTVCLEQIAGQFSDVLKSNAFLALSSDSVIDILNIDDISGDFSGEIEVFRAVMEYIDQNATSIKHNQIKYNNLIKHIRFPTMTTEDFLKCLSSKPKLLSHYEIGAIGNEILTKSLNGCGFSSIPRTVTKTGISTSCEFVSKIWNKCEFPFIPQWAKENGITTKTIIGVGVGIFLIAYVKSNKME